jgi:hypothetical protein
MEEKTPEQPVPEGWSHADFQRLKNFDVSGYLATFSRDELIFIMLNLHANRYETVYVYLPPLYGRGSPIQNRNVN